MKSIYRYLVYYYWMAVYTRILFTLLTFYYFYYTFIIHLYVRFFYPILYLYLYFILSHSLFNAQLRFRIILGSCLDLLLCKRGIDQLLFSAIRICFSISNIIEILLDPCVIIIGSLTVWLVQEWKSSMVNF